MTTAETLPAVDVRADYDRDLAWLDRVLELEVLRLRAHYELSMDELRGLYISDRQVDDLLRHRSGGMTPDPVEWLTQEGARLYAMRPDCTPLHAIARRFALSEVERDVLMIALAPEVSLKYETLYAYLNNDITRKHATVDLAVRLLGPSSSDAEVRAVLRPGGRLFTAGLLESIEPGPDRRSLRAQGFALAIPVAQYLLGLPPDDPRLPASIQQTPVVALPADAASIGPAARLAVERFSDDHPVAPGLVVCTGDSTLEQLAAAGLHASRHEHGLIAVPLATALTDAAAWASLRARLSLLATLTPALVAVYDENDGFPREPHALAQYVRIVRDLTSSGVPLFLAVPRESGWAVAVAEIPFAELALPELSAPQRLAAWLDTLRDKGIDADGGVMEELGLHFVLSYPRIVAAASTAAGMCSAVEGADGGIRESLWQAARRHSSQSLAQLTSRVVKPHRWEHLVLPEATLRRVREIASAIRHRERVFHSWRMAERTGRGNGLMVLFAGSSGTGKTMTAAVVANGLGLELYRIDLASVVSKYIGETEKNLDRIFEAARRSNGLLLFDEADALLGKRSEVKDAHDRYANIEIAYLLQKMEEHDGVVILATNLARNLDQAFARRMHYVVEFPRPDAVLRERLWRGMFPRETPLADDVDFRFLAEQFETSGGEIQTVALDAAFLASAENGAVQMVHVVQAMARHQLKQGNPASTTSFKQYYDVVRAG